MTDNNGFKARGSKCFYFPGLENIVWHRSRINRKCTARTGVSMATKKSLREKHGIAITEDCVCVCERENTSSAILHNAVMQAEAFSELVQIFEAGTSKSHAVCDKCT